MPRAVAGGSQERLRRRAVHRRRGGRRQRRRRWVRRLMRCRRLGAVFPRHDGPQPRRRREGGGRQGHRARGWSFVWGTRLVRGYGAMVPGGDSPPNKSTVFELASVTKVVTCPATRASPFACCTSRAIAPDGQLPRQPGRCVRGSRATRRSCNARWLSSRFPRRAQRGAAGPEGPGAFDGGARARARDRRPTPGRRSAPCDGGRPSDLRRGGARRQRPCVGARLLDGRSGKRRTPTDPLPRPADLVPRTDRAETQATHASTRSDVRSTRQRQRDVSSFADTARVRRAPERAVRPGTRGAALIAHGTHQTQQTKRNTSLYPATRAPPHADGVDTHPLRRLLFGRVCERSSIQRRGGGAPRGGRGVLGQFRLVPRVLKGVRVQPSARLRLGLLLRVLRRR
jgi:hypothetical protein